MIRRLPVLLLLLPIVELVVAIQVGRWIGAGPTILLILAGMVAGVLVLRREGSGALGDLRAAQQRVEQRFAAAQGAAGRAFGAGTGTTVTPDGGVLSAPPTGPRRRPAERLLVVLAGVLLLVPGLVSDVAGLLLLLPPVRRLVAARAAASARRGGWTVSTLTPGAGGADVRVVSVDDVVGSRPGTPTGEADEQAPHRPLGPGPSR